MSDDAMASHPNRSSPFTQQLIGNHASQGTNETKLTAGDLTSLLPASRRTTEDDLVTPALSPVFDSADIDNDRVRLAIHDWIDEETDLHRLADIHSWLWIVGRPTPPRPLHQQRLLNREIVITEKLDLHLVWTTNRIFIKPLPCFLLEPRFWEKFLSSCCAAITATNADSCTCACCGRRKRALGFFFSYVALIAHESDFRIATDAYLVPKEVQWSSWQVAVRELLGAYMYQSSSIYPRIDPRFHYGELRLSRLNKIYFLWKTPLRGYIPRWNQYGSFFHDNFTLIASSTVYIAVVLTAMQVGLATEALQESKAFQSASYGFTIFSIIGPLAAVGLVVVVFCYLFVSNWIATRRYSRERLERIQG